MKLKASIFHLSFLLLLIVTTSCKDKAKADYRKDLNIVSNIETLRKLVKENPNKALIDIEKSIPNIVLDIRYATTNNFTNQQIYKSAQIFLRQPAAEALLKVQTKLNTQGLGIKIFDAYRPYTATVKLYEVYPDKDFVAPPWSGSRHNRACAVDLTLIDLKTGVALEMPTPYDSFKAEAAADYQNLTATILKNRDVLQKAMLKYGFLIYPYEWWHFDYKDWNNYGLLDIAFEDLK